MQKSAGKRIWEKRQMKRRDRERDRGDLMLDLKVKRSTSNSLAHFFVVWHFRLPLLPVQPGEGRRRRKCLEREGATGFR